MNTQELAEKLVQYPELKKRVEELILLVENSDGESQLAQQQAEQVAHQVTKQLPKACKHIKKSKLA